VCDISRGTSVHPFFEVATTPNPTTSTALLPKQSGMTTFVGGNKSLTAEVLWTVKVMTSHYSYKSSDNVAALFGRMFPDSATVAQFTCGERKCAYVACFGIVPYFKQQLVKDIKQLDGCVLMFAESANKATQTKQMDIHLRFWKNQQVESRYLTSHFLGHSAATDMLGKITSCFAENEIDISRFTDSFASRQDFMDITSSNMFPLKYCKHRWLENVPVVRRA